MLTEKEKCCPAANVEQQNVSNDNLASDGVKGEVSYLHLKAQAFLIRKLERLGLPQSAILPYPDVKLILSSMMHLNKDESFKVMKELSELGLVEIVSNHGIRIIRQGRRV